jgi:hypothetical protein
MSLLSRYHCPTPIYIGYSGSCQQLLPGAPDAFFIYIVALKGEIHGQWKTSRGSKFITKGASLPSGNCYVIMARKGKIHGQWKTQLSAFPAGPELL